MNRLVKCSAIAGAALLLLGALTDVRINTTKSIPLGFYRMTSDPVEKGSYVIFCPPNETVFDDAKERGYIGAGYCPGGYGYLMKRILASESDVVDFSDDGVLVNGELLAFSAPLKTDKVGRPLPRVRLTMANQYRLGAAELLLMSDMSGTSFDGRYFGPINRKQVQGVIRPILTW